MPGYDHVHRENDRRKKRRAKSGRIVSERESEREKNKNEGVQWWIIVFEEHHVYV